MPDAGPAAMAAPGQLHPLRTRLALMLGVAGAVLAACLAVILASLAWLADSRAAVVDRIDPAALAAHDLKAAMVDQETGVRGYALAGERSFLEPYERGRAAEGELVDRLHAFLDREPDFAPDLAAVERAMAEWRRVTAEPTIAAVERGDRTVASTEFQDQGRARFNEVRATIDRLDAELTIERQIRADNLWRGANRVGLAVAVLAGAMVVVGVALTRALRRSVTRPVERLSREVRLVAAGDLQRQVTVGGGAAELVGLAHDIDAMRLRILDELEHLRQASAAIERQALELARSNDDLEQFAYVASHDLQEPLRKVAGFCQLLERRYGGKLDDRGHEYIHYAVDGAQRMQRLINDLLAFSRVGRTTEGFEPVALAGLVHQALDNLSGEVEARQASIEIGALPTVTGDARLLTVLFQNLIGNAIKFHRPGVAPRATVSAHAPAGATEATISVSDNGIGIEDRYGEQIFTLFRRLHTRTEYEGTGIGLALCKRIVEFHGGRIWLEPAAGVGSTFRFTLPFDQEHVP